MDVLKIPRNSVTISNIYNWCPLKLLLLSNIFIVFHKTPLCDVVDSCYNKLEHLKDPLAKLKNIYLNWSPTENIEHTTITTKDDLPSVVFCFFTFHLLTHAFTFFPRVFCCCRIWLISFFICGQISQVSNFLNSWNDIKIGLSIFQIYFYQVILYAL